ncbi:maltose alpha-D-glucosyltransferase/ alpha-amylase [Blastococcus sp. DSM 46786]|uniref:alpha-amylase family protein n=1 Tax=Blastococcus sp. DSM 46786 TaxID=1798227 RepID=UPI0008B01982|nr:alpha-amylase family protein [Blastococcus sp. DSM 46786]SEL23103.1 maltose alpha-D-glucosyltransferase/ alpha-amylase [Blastococcus sp. DSM 46786]
MFDPAVSDQWWKNAVVYSVDVETFMDSDGDGIGDFRGLTRRLPYLSGLGVTCLWLLPFYPSPNTDDGYDVSDYYTVEPRFGTLGEFVEFVRTARDLGIRVVIDLVVNHTSDQHPWFRSARRDRDSRYRDWYVWADERPEDEATVIFPDQEESNWAWDEEAGQYYLHRFYSSEPDLNTANPDVRDEIHRIMGFWLELGVSGFRVDAAPYLIGDTGIEDRMPQDPHLILQDMRGFLSRRRGDAVLFGEVNLDPGDRETFFGDDGDEMTGMFNFILSGSVFTALARGEATPLAEHLRRTPSPPRTSQWLNFLRNHDELNLSRLPDDEKDDVMAAFAPEQDMRIYGRGIRRRLPPMLGGDRRRIELAFSLLLTLPGTPVLLYGEEIGMGDDLAIEGRKSVRTVMQWTEGPNGGFSSGSDLAAPVVDDGPFRYQEVNVAEQRRREDSLLNRVERAIRVRKESPEFGWGAWTVLDSGDPRVLAHRCDWLEGTVIAVHNLSGDHVETRLEPAREGEFEEVIDIFGNDRFEPLDPGDPRVSLGPYGYRWLRGRRSGSGLTP